MPVKYGDVVFMFLVGKNGFNSMQRMSAIATKTNSFVKLLEGTNTKILDTRKTTPGFRVAESGP
jgi:nicotinate-nucleotide pyrophosphorylase (carboxylating)